VGWLVVLLAAAVATLFLGRTKVPPVLGAIVTIGLGAVPILLDPSGRSAVYGFLVVLFILLGSRLAGEAREAGLDTRTAPNHGLSLDECAAKEVTRARRHERPLSVVTLRMTSSNGSAGSKTPPFDHVAKVFASSLRLTDVSGYLGSSRLIALLPETTASEAAVFLQRISSALGGELADRLVAGVASFPDHEVTWVGLKSRSCAGERPLSAYGGQVFEKDLVGDLERAVGEQSPPAVAPNTEGSGAA
jgi:hypothetical protein